MVKPSRLAFATYAVGAAQGQKAVVLVKSIRRFGGVHRGARVFVAADASASAAVKRSGDELVDLLPLDVPVAARGVPLAVKAYAAAQSERAAAASVDTMLWLDPETVLLGQPDGLELRAREAVALQPVFLPNTVGQLVSEPIDAYWSRIYGLAGVGSQPVPEVSTVVDGARIRFYINCGAIAYRPSRGLCAEWARVLTALLESPGDRSVVLADDRHALFLHQAVLSAVIAARTRPSERRWIPVSHGYPFGQHDRLPAARRATRLEDVVCLIYDDAWDAGPEWMEKIQVGEPLRGWLRAAWEQSLAVPDRISRDERLCGAHLGVADARKHDRDAIL